MKKKVYFAARYDHRKDLLELSQKLPSPWKCCSRWLQGLHVSQAGYDELTNELVPAIGQETMAVEDLQDLLDMDALVFFASPGGQRGGRWVEFGVALGCNKPIIVVSYGEKLNTFQYLPQLNIIDDWDYSTLPGKLSNALESLSFST